MKIFSSILLLLALIPVYAQDTTFILSGDQFTERINIENDTLHVYFEHDKYKLNPHFEHEVREMAEKLLKSYNKILYIHGYTDHVGEDKYNKWLSRKRAQAVHSELLNASVPRNLIESIKGKGEIESDLPEYQRIPKDRKVVLVLADRNVKKSLREVEIDSLRKGDEVMVQNLNFQPGRHMLLNESIPHLKDLLEVMQSYPGLNIELQGHVCCAPEGEDGIDQDTKTQDLSVRRAKNIYEYLVRNGVDSTRMTYKGFARTRPIYPMERNEYEKKMNRRVEIKVLDNRP